MQYGRLPQGTYEYCVEALPKGSFADESAVQPSLGCVYHTVEDLFGIHLMDPEDGAKLTESHPVLSWTVSYPFAGELSYRLRVAELQPGQSAATAMQRNNPVWQESGLRGLSAPYPVSARPLELWQPYVWTVDAYFRGLLLGGSEVWKFVLVDDSVMAGLPRESAFIDLRRELTGSTYYAVGKVRVRYELKERRASKLNFSLLNESGQRIRLRQEIVAIAEGDNRLEIDLSELSGMKHLQRYRLRVADEQGNDYELPIRYVNPDFVR
jgi:hypothetical protein